MSDLISRSALLKKFDDTGIHITFDLPVEEILGESVDIDDFTMLVQDAIQAYRNMVIDTIKKQPTAYDVEKVVAELKDKSDYEPIDYDCGDMACTAEQYFIATDDAIGIVKKGGDLSNE